MNTITMPQPLLQDKIIVPEQISTTLKPAANIPFLDGLRAIAVLMVITAHVRSDAWRGLKGYLGVTIFFVLSGYLITSLAIREESRRGSISMRSFYLRRTFRIFPLYYLTLGIYTALILLSHSLADKKVGFLHALPYYLTYCQDIAIFSRGGSDSLPFYHSWSLGIEEKFYLLWPLIAFVLLRGRPRLRLLAAILLAIMCSFVGSFVGPYTPILFGCALACCLHYSHIRIFVARYASGGTLVAIFLMLATHTAIAFGHLRGSGNSLYALCVAALIACLLSSEGIIKSALSFRPLTAIGKLSYGIYLFHILCLNVVVHFTKSHNLATYALTTLTACGVAAALHRWFEQPFIRLGRRLSSHYA